MLSFNVQYRQNECRCMCALQAKSVLCSYVHMLIMFIKTEGIVLSDASSANAFHAEHMLCVQVLAYGTA